MSSARARRQRGSVYVEFLLVLPPIALLCLCGLQLALLASTQLGVNHAAQRAARSAAVILADDPIHYDGQPGHQLPTEGPCRGSLLRRLSTLLGIGAIDTGSPQCPGGERWARVRFTAAASLLPFSPSIESVLPSEGPGLHGFSLPRWVAGASAYLEGAMSVGLVEGTAPRPRSFPLSLEEGELLRLRVSYLSPCVVPLARHIMCESGLELRSSNAVRAFEAEVGSKGLLDAILLAARGRFVLQHGEAAFPLQSMLVGKREAHPWQ